MFSANSANPEALDEGEQGRVALMLVREYEHHSDGWFWRTDTSGAIVYLSAKVAAEVADHDVTANTVPLTEVLHAPAEAQGKRTLPFHLASRTAFSDLAVRTDHGGVERWWSISGRPVLDALGHFQGFVGSGRDLTEQRRAEAEITRLALSDSLTGLANRQQMNMMLDQALARAQTVYCPHGLLLLDLDRFKAVNDTLGHQTGDALLQQVAQRLLRCVDDAGLVGRLGGDEFHVFLANEGNRDRLSSLADEIIRALSQPYFVQGSSIIIGCSIGVAVSPDDGLDTSTLVRSADLALYAAKGAGRGVHRFYDPEMLAGAQGRKRLEDDLRTAIGQNQLSVVYQPVVSIADVKVVGYEALVRWTHPTRGPISPAVFIPMAEECGLIEQIGEWVLRTATAEAAQWPGSVRVAVNISPIQFANPALLSTIASAIARSGIAPSRLELELTESVFLNASTSSEQMFKNLKHLGVRLALDDFGTGYSSLGYLRTAPFDKIKIDQSFVRGAAVPGNRNAAIIQAIVTLANSLEMETTAEGVEVQDEIDLVRELGCSHIQGYVYGAPQPACAVREQLAGQGTLTPKGHRVSRAPRVRTLRWALLQAAGASGSVRIRNMSTRGAMVDLGELRLGDAGTSLTLEIADGVVAQGQVRWRTDRQVGIQFDSEQQIERLVGQGGSRR